MAISGLLLVAVSQTGSPASLMARPRPAVPAAVTITIGNITIGSQPAVPRGHGSVVTRPARGALIDRRPDLGIDVTVTGGRLSSVAAIAVRHRQRGTLPGQTGSGSARAVPGVLGAGGTTWRSDWALAPAQAYRVMVTAVNPQGRQTVTAGTFQTLTPRRTFTASTSIGPGEVVGVGMPIMVSFSHPVTDRTEVERALEIWSSKPVTGAWYWMGDSQVWFRPRTYWPAHTQVRFEAHLKGVQGARGVYGAANLGQHFRIGNSLVVVASAASHHMKVWWNGHLEGDWPVSTGQPGDDTPDGHYLSFSMGNPVDMNSATYGVMPGEPGYYNVMVYDSVKFTYSGDYVHSAPWSVAEQGFANVSHGCVNVAPLQAAWYYDHSTIGDPITVVGSPLKGTWGDGWTIWFLPWHKLLAGSATRQVVLASARGSRFASPHLAMPSSMHVGPVGP